MGSPLRQARITVISIEVVVQRRPGSGLFRRTALSRWKSQFISDGAYSWLQANQICCKFGVCLAFYSTTQNQFAARLDRDHDIRHSRISQGDPIQLGFQVDVKRVDFGRWVIESDFLPRTDDLLGAIHSGIHSV